jgi:hypothetical protein
MTFHGDRVRQKFFGAVTTGSPPTLAATQNQTEIQDPFFCIGLTGITAGSTVNFELFLNLEYTVTSGASNIVETKAGTMSSTQSFGIVKKIGGNLQNLVETDPESSLGDKFWNLGKSVLKSGLSRASEFVFGSSDVGKAVNAFFE